MDDSVLFINNFDSLIKSSERLYSQFQNNQWREFVFSAEPISVKPEKDSAVFDCTFEVQCCSFGRPFVVVMADVDRLWSKDFKL
jgi:hypothetical protein